MKHVVLRLDQTAKQTRVPARARYTVGQEVAEQLCLLLHVVERGTFITIDLNGAFLRGPQRGGHIARTQPQRIDVRCSAKAVRIDQEEELTLGIVGIIQHQRRLLLELLARTDTTQLELPRRYIAALLRKNRLELERAQLPGRLEAEVTGWNALREVA